MKKNRLITALLLAALITIPGRIRADDPPPDKDMLIFACGIVAIGTVVVIGLYYACKHIPPPPGMCRCGCSSMSCGCPGAPTNTLFSAPSAPSGPVVTNPPAAQSAALSQLRYEAATPFPSGSMVDDQGNTWNYDAAFSFALQTSVDLTNWESAFTLNGWLLGSGALYSIRSNGVTLANVYFTEARNPTNAIPLDLPSGAQRFYRIACQ